jgi:hypothetical protein
VIPQEAMFYSYGQNIIFNDGTSKCAARLDRIVTVHFYRVHASTRRCSTAPELIRAYYTPIKYKSLCNAVAELPVSLDPGVTSDKEEKHERKVRGSSAGAKSQVTGQRSASRNFLVLARRSAHQVERPRIISPRLHSKARCRKAEPREKPAKEVK